MGKLISFFIFTIFVTGLLFANAALMLKQQIAAKNTAMQQTIVRNVK